MNGKSISVAAALLAGGGALYGGYQLVDERQDAAVEARADLPDARGERVALDAEPGPAASRGGVPEGMAALDFDGGAAGDDLTAAARARTEEAEREAERLAMLGTGDADATRRPGGRLGDADAAADDLATDDLATDDPATDGANRARGLRDAAALGAAGADAERDRPDDTDVERLLADIAAQSGAADGADDRAGVAAPGGATRYAANTRLADKPDRGGFTANRRLTDKPDEGGYVASADTQRFDPCEKADGTAYAGPGTALNPFAATDPCLPQATAQGYQVAQLAGPDVAPALQVAEAVPALVAVDVPRPRLAPPPPTGTGSDYRG